MSYVLPRLDGEVGLYLALTGKRVETTDIVVCQKDKRERAVKRLRNFYPNFSFRKLDLRLILFLLRISLLLNKNLEKSKPIISMIYLPGIYLPAFFIFLTFSLVRSLQIDRYNFFAFFIFSPHFFRLNSFLRPLPKQSAIGPNLAKINKIFAHDSLVEVFLALFSFSFFLSFDRLLQLGLLRSNYHYNNINLDFRST